jgi:hypothetical protein
VICLPKTTLATSKKHGNGVTQDDGQPLNWYLKSADDGDVDARYQICFSTKPGTAQWKDYGEALGWHRTGGDQGDMYGEGNLGVSY